MNQSQAQRTVSIVCLQAALGHLMWKGNSFCTGIFLFRILQIRNRIFRNCKCKMQQLGASVWLPWGERLCSKGISDVSMNGRLGSCTADKDSRCLSLKLVRKLPQPPPCFPSRTVGTQAGPVTAACLPERRGFSGTVAWGWGRPPGLGSLQTQCCLLASGQTSGKGSWIGSLLRAAEVLGSRPVEARLGPLLPRISVDKTCPEH